MPTIKKIPKTVEIMHAVTQGQGPSIAKTEEMPQAQFMPATHDSQLCRDSAHHPGDPED